MITGHLNKTLQTAQGEQELRVDLSIKEGELVAVYGDSGVGKTTVLRILAGLAQPDSGELYVNGNCWLDTNKKISWTAQQRKVGMVFQDYALFPNMTVLENLQFAANNERLINELLEYTELESLQNRKPNTLSGGQQQRVALARALVMEPQLLLLDEPLSALDLRMRKQLQQLILDLHQRYNVTTIMVSHNVPEVLKLADKVLLLEGGQAAKLGDPKTLLAEKGVDLPLQIKGEVISIEENWILIKIGENLNRIQRSSVLNKEIKVGATINIEVLMTDFNNS
ncbi:MAG: ATP-binding cassette domain-containing protein [Aureispira sp.]|nr:ATP-binding cassette domain-containing protein [Aureispira sp.]